MKPIAATVAAALMLGLLAGNGPAVPDHGRMPSLAGYSLVWADEFDRQGPPDPASWTFETGFVRNGEMQWYQPDNAYVQGGLLVIEARRERKPNPDFGNPDVAAEFGQRRQIRYTSASVTTRGLREWRYGRFEIRARIRPERGLWPAIWTLGSEGRWPARGEIDLMEYYDDSILANFAWAGADHSRPVWKAVRKPLRDLTDDPAWGEQFHTWVMDWSEDEITLWLDGRLMNRLRLDDVRNGGAEGRLPHPFRQPHYLLLNLALGGEKGGPLADTGFPSRYEIDYVRVYQRQEGTR